MNKYELLLTLPGTLDEKEAAQHIEEISALVKGVDQEAQVKNLGKIRLAYPIKQIRYGYFYTIIFQTEVQSNVPGLNKKLGLRNDILRFTLSYYNAKAEAAGKAIKRQVAEAVAPVSLAESEFIREVSGATAADALSAERTAVSQVAVADVKPAEALVVAKPKHGAEKKIDLKDIGDKLDEILNSDVVSGV